MLICKIISKTLITMLTTLRKFISDWHGTILSTMLVLAACSSCERLDDSSKLESSRTITLKYKVAPMDVSTYANPSADEMKVNSLLVLFFNAGGGKYVGYATNPTIVKTMNDVAGVPLTLPTGVSVGSSYDVLVIANCLSGGYGFPNDMEVSSYIPYIAENKTAEEVAASLYVTLPTAAAAISSDNLLMWGIKSNVQVSATPSVDVVLGRSIVRLDVVNTAADFVVNSVMVYNGASSVAPFSAVTPSSRINYTKEYSFMDQKATLYFFPSSVAECKQNDTKTTCLIVKGQYNGNQTATYYRANLVFKGSNQNLEKNKLYTLTISSVSGDGFANAGDAYASSKSKIAYSLTSDWENTNDYNPATVTDGISSIWVSNRKVSLSFEKDVSDNITIVATGGSVAVTENLGWLDVTSSDNITYTLKTNSANTATDRTGTVTFTVGGVSLAVNVTQWAILLSEKSLTVNDGTAEVGGGDVTIPVITSGNGIDFSHSALTGLSGWTITKSGSDIVVNTDAQPDNAPTTAREASFTVNSADGLSKTVKVYQPARPATIALNPGTLTTPFSSEGESRTYTFTCSYGNLSSAGIDIMVSNSGFSVDLSGNTVTVTATTKQEIFGAPKRSALITVAAQNGATYSFMVEQEEVAIASNSEVVQVGGSGIYWDNRNLGATSSLFFTNQNPTAIGTNVDAKGLYYTISANPCTNPKRPPTQEELKALIDNVKFKYDNSKGYGIYYVDGVTRAGAKKRIFFPLAGYDDGTLDNKNRTSIGYYWSSSVSDGSNNFFLQLGSDGTNNGVITSRSNTTMYSVRCVEP